MVVILFLTLHPTSSRCHGELEYLAHTLRIDVCHHRLLVSNSNYLAGSFLIHHFCGEIRGRPTPTAIVVHEGKQGQWQD